MTTCPTCKKKPVMANKRKLLRGHYNIVNRYKKHVNLQWALVGGKRIKMCTDCIRTIHKTPRA